VSAKALKSKLAWKKQVKAPVPEQARESLKSKEKTALADSVAVKAMNKETSPGASEA
jgi:hypothetical protein